MEDAEEGLEYRLEHSQLELIRTQLIHHWEYGQKFNKSLLNYDSISGLVSKTQFLCIIRLHL